MRFIERAPFPGSPSPPPQGAVLGFVTPFPGGARPSWETLQLAGVKGAGRDAGASPEARRFHHGRARGGGRRAMQNDNWVRVFSCIREQNRLTYWVNRTG